MNSIQLIAYSFPSNFISQGFTSNFISYPSYSTAYVGFIWNFIITQSTTSESLYISHVTSNNCIVAGCSACNPAIIDLSATGCLSLQSSPYFNSAGQGCTGCSDGCYGGLCLTCSSCKELSCVAVSGNIACACPPGIPSINGSCACPNQYFFHNFSCKKCLSTCISCTNTSTCASCITNNAIPSNGGCVCSIGFYNSTELITIDACWPCSALCTVCDVNGNCIGCTKANMNITRNCQCNDGYFYSNGLCNICNNVCKTCSDSITCLTCLTVNAIPDTSGCKCKAGYGSTAQLSDINACQPCNNTCIGCTGVNQCIQCKDINAIPDFVGCKCKNGFYLKDLVCVACPKDCESCNSSSCITCLSLFAVPRSMNCYCPDGTFSVPNQNYTECKQCNNDCATCLTDQNCATCKIINALPNNGCKCADGYYSDSIKCSVCSNWNSVQKSCVFCSSNQYFDGSMCVKCGELCRSCNKNECTSCIEYAQLVNGDCTCNSGYEGTVQCNPVSFEMKINVLSSSLIILGFTQDLSQALDTTDFLLIAQNNNISCGINMLNLRQYQISIHFSVNIGNETKITLLFVNPIISSLNATLVVKNYEFYVYAEETTIGLQQKIIQSQAIASVFAASSLTLLISLINLNFISLWSFLNTIQMITYISLTRIQFPPTLMMCLKSFKQATMFPNLFDYLIDSGSFVRPSQIYIDFGIKSTCLLLNIGHLVSAFLFLLFQMIFLLIFSKLEGVRPFSIGFIKEIIGRSLQKYRYNAFLRYYIQVYMDFAICAFVGVLSVNLTSVPQLFNYILCTLIVIFTAITPIRFIIFVLAHKLEIKSNSEVLGSKYGSLFYEFTNDHGLFCSMFYFFFFLRRFTFICIVLIFSDYVLVQMILNLIFTISFAFYLIKYMPFNEKFVNYSNIYSELVIAVVYFCLPIYGTLSSAKNKEGVDYFLVYSVFSIVVVHTISALGILVRNIYMKIKQILNRRKTQVIPMSPSTNVIESERKITENAWAEKI